ncbi:MAG: beta strand repeat-containing protein, partial [Candidatus Methylumidiphilus sp.]
MKNHAFSFRPRLLVLSMLLAATQPAASAVRTWDGNGNTDNWGFINNPSLNTNWTANAPTLTHPLPDSGDSLIFAGNTRTANTNDLSALSVAGLSFAAGAGAFTLGGNALTSTGNITNSSSNLQTINLPISVGGIQTWDGGAPGLTVNGAVTLGNNALTLQNKTAIANGSSTVVVGNGGTASLNLQSGSTITANEGTIGNTPSGNGTVTVDGAGSAWNNAARMFVGLSGAGSLTIQNGGKVSNGQGYLGYFAGSSGTATVTGAGSQWINNADLKVGITDDGVLSILNGGSVSNNDGYLGYISGSTGSVTVGGAGSAWNNANNLYLGFDANAASSVTVNGGGTVSMGNALNIGEKGALNLSGGTVTAASASKAAGGQFNWTSGTLQLAGLDLDAGSSLFGHSLALGSGQQFNTTGLLNLGAAGSVNVGSGATLQVGAGGTVGSVSGNITDNGQVVFNRSNDLSYDGVISGSGGLAKNGGGVLTLTGTNTYT